MIKATYIMYIKIEQEFWTKNNNFCLRFSRKQLTIVKERTRVSTRDLFRHPAT